MRAVFGRRVDDAELQEVGRVRDREFHLLAPCVLGSVKLVKSAKHSTLA